MFRDLECIGASIEQRTRRFRVVGVKRFDSHRIMARYLVRVLDLNRMEGVGTVNNEVDFDACFRAPERELVFSTAVVVPCREMLEDETFQTGPVLLRIFMGCIVPYIRRFFPSLSNGKFRPG